ncbi:MAG: histidine phosphatase family protein [Acidobacteria bacterium]|nr:histidine phosphatase family protein [Acidobacteriota bacterium]MCG3193627.1 Phosphoserine phosphatase 1 [Thermoanaerobaculia bacterium]MCK6682900.1 histidine phosphatase family protein [Thermoanaerobaculia bacterium]
MRIRIVRHGESEGNRASTLQGCRIDAPLSPKGRRQAEALSIRLACEEIDYVLSSPMRRALDTAKVLEAPHGIGIEIEPVAVEFDWGEWTGQPLDDEMERNVAGIRTRWKAGDVDLGPPRGESPVKAAERARRVLERILEKGARAPVIVAHGRFNRILITTLLGRDISRMDEVRQRNSSLSVLDWNGEDPATAQMIDDTSHLEGALAAPAGKIDSLLR